MEKLTSRKLWASIIGVVTGLMMYFTGDKTEGTALIISSILGYLAAEGIIDAAATKNVIETVDEIGQKVKGDLDEEGN